MKRARNAWLHPISLVALVLLSGCGGGNSNGISSPPVLTGPEFLYVGTGNNSPATGPAELLRFPIDSSTGALGAPATITATGSILGTVGDPFGKVLYTTEDGVGIHEYSIDGATGTLSEFSGSPFAAAVNGVLFTDTHNDFFYVGTCPFARSNTGTLTGNPANCSQQVGGFKASVDPGNQFVLLACDNRGEAVCVTTRDLNTGVLTLVSINDAVFANFYQPTDVVVHPSGKFAYSSGPFAGFQGPPPIPPSPTFEEIAVFSLDRPSGDLHILNQVDLPFVPDSQVMAMDPAGKFLYAADSTKILAFSINAADGSLTPIAGSPFLGTHKFALGANVFHVDPAGKFLYLTALDSNAVFGYAIDPATGSLSPIPGSPFPIGAIPLTLSVVRTP
ncbi:MAG TPA: beta-propeller fold lactonase family protein [Candidatus Angelobacter sp.]|nr:beta-propeller fold lactonase family protein [Candidatus Angelobacter sp.]